MPAYMHIYVHVCVCVCVCVCVRVNLCNKNNDRGLWGVSEIGSSDAHLDLAALVQEHGNNPTLLPKMRAVLAFDLCVCWCVCVLCVFVCVHACVRVCACVYVITHTHTHTHTHIRIQIHTSRAASICDTNWRNFWRYLLSNAPRLATSSRNAS